MKNLPYGHQHIDSSDIEAVKAALKSDWLTQGPLLEQFEKEIAQYCRTPFAAAVSSGTAGLYLAYRSIGLKKGDEVITTPLTFAATSSMILACSAKPVLADIELETLNIDPAQIRRKITKKTKAIAFVDFAGQPSKIDELKAIAKEHNLWLIEDGAHSLGSLYKGQPVGSLADLTVFSFHPVKLITTGEGGMVVSAQERLIKQIKKLRHHGIEKKPGKGGWYYQIERPSFNFRLSELQSALGLSQLKKIQRFIERRREIVEKYNKAFSQIEQLIILKEKNYSKSAWHLYPLQFDLKKFKSNRRQIFDFLQSQGLGVQVHYLPLHLQPFFQKEFGLKVGGFPQAEAYYQRAVSLPLFPSMQEADVLKTIEAVKKAVSFFKK